MSVLSVAVWTTPDVGQAVRSPQVIMLNYTLPMTVAV